MKRVEAFVHLIFTRPRLRVDLLWGWQHTYGPDEPMVEIRVKESAMRCDLLLTREQASFLADRLNGLLVDYLAHASDRDTP